SALERRLGQHSLTRLICEPQDRVDVLRRSPALVENLTDCAEREPLERTLHSSPVQRRRVDGLERRAAPLRGFLHRAGREPNLRSLTNLRFEGLKCLLVLALSGGRHTVTPIQSDQ